MKSFAFSLAKVRDYKEQLLEKEKISLVNLQKKEEVLRQKAETLTAYMTEKRDILQHQQEIGVCLNEILPLRFLIDTAEEDMVVLKKAQDRVKDEVGCQRQKVLQISQELSGLDKLEEKKLEEHRYLSAKENERLMLEHLSTQISYGEAQGIS